MKLVLLGTGGYYPTSKRHTACLMLPSAGIVLDAGSGMCRLGEFLQTDRLDIFISHAHLDHVLGLTYLINTVPPDVIRNTTVHGDATKLAAIRDHLFNQSIFPIEPAFHFAPLSENSTLPDCSMSHFGLVHPGGSIGYRFDWPDRSLAYITDTTADISADYVDKIRGVDMLVHECNFADNDRDLPAITGHSWLLPVAEVAAAAGVGRLLLVHIGPQNADDEAFDLPSARRIFRNTELGTDGDEIEF
jgi:ribonuclease BN (tRNA processing enzyme)